MWVDAKQGFIPAEGVEYVLRQVAGHVERRIESEGGVAFGHDEAVAVGIVRLSPENSPVQGGQYVSHRERRPDVADVRPLRLVKDVAPKALAGDRHRHLTQSSRRYCDGERGKRRSCRRQEPLRRRCLQPEDIFWTKPAREGSLVGPALPFRS